MNENAKNLFEEIKYSYTSLQMSIFFDFCIKAQKNTDFFKTILNISDMEVLYFEGDGKYKLKKDYIEYGIETSINNGLNFGILGDMAVLHSFSHICKIFKEIIDKDEEFKTFIISLFTIKGYDNLYSILGLIRNIGVHGSFSRNYRLKQTDFSIWQKSHKKKGIKKLKLKLSYETHEIEIAINIDEIVEGYDFSKILDAHKMLIFIEVFVLLINDYEKSFS